MRLALSYVTYVFIGWFKFLLLNCSDSVRGEEWGSQRNGWSAGPCPNITEWASKDVITWAPGAVVWFCSVVIHPHVSVYNPKHSMHHPPKIWYINNWANAPSARRPSVCPSVYSLVHDITPNVNDVRLIQVGKIKWQDPLVSYFWSYCLFLFLSCSILVRRYQTASTSQELKLLLS